MKSPKGRREQRDRIDKMLVAIRRDVHTSMHELDSKMLDESTAKLIGGLGAAISAITIGLQSMIAIDREEHP